MSDLYLDILPKIYTPFFKKTDEERKEMYPNIFDVILPNFLKQIEERCKDGFLVGDSLSICDFWIGGLYTNFFANPNIGFGKEHWDACLAKFPAFKAYGERFAEVNKAWISTRQVAAI